MGGSGYLRVIKLTLKYLGMPATSVPSERVFSKTEEIVNRRRASLKQSNVDMTVFLSRNLPALQLSGCFHKSSPFANSTLLLSFTL